jgi:arylsulfatase A-like enzyme
VRRSCALLALVAACHGKKHEAPVKNDATVAPAPADALAKAQSPKPKALPPPRTEHIIWSAVDNRHLAHRLVEGELVIDAGDIGFARYIRFGLPQRRWKLGQTVDGTRVAIADRLASLEVPLVKDEVTATQVTLLVRAANKQSLTLKVNGRGLGKPGTARLEDGWQTLEFDVPAGRFVVGENQLALETSGASGNVAVSWLRIGSLHPAADKDPRSDALFAPPADAIELADGAALAWYLTIPEGANLIAQVPAPCHVEVAARTSEDTLAGGLLGATDDRVDLSALSGKVARVTLTARDCPKVHITHPAITVHGPAPTPLPPGEPPRFVVLWVMDATRADKIPIFTPGARAKTPNLDELAKSSAVFRQYYVQGNESQTSHSSVWTALYPAVHNVRLAGQGGDWKLAGRFDVLGDVLRTAGLYTIGVTGNGYVNEDGGYARGFAEYRNMMREPAAANGILFGKQIVDAALEKLGKHRDQPAFLFLGTVDNHFPWIARRPWIDEYSPNYKGPFQEFATPIDLGFKPNSMGCGVIPPAADIERLRAIYDSDISYQDAQLGRFIDQLKSWGIWDDTMLIITADHGDEIFEDHRCGHGGSLRDSLVRVPLLVHDPQRFPGGTIVDEGAEGVDILPTILTSLGQPVFEAAQGAPLQSLAQGIGRGFARQSYASMYEYAHAMRIGRWKIRVGVNGTPLVDDLVADPDEKADLTMTQPIERRMLTDDMGLFLGLRAKWRKGSWGPVTNMTAAGAAALDEVTVP